MGFLSKLRDRVNAQIGQPTFDNPDGRMYAGGSPGLYAPGGRFNRGGRGSRIMPNQGIPSLPQNLDFLSRLPKNMMPKVDFSNIPQLPENFQFNPQMGQGGTSLNFADYKPQDRQIMQYGGEARPGYAFGGPSQMTQGSQHMMPDGRQMPGANHAEYEANMQRPGYAIGGPLVGRAANLANQVLSKNRMGRNVPGRATSNMGDMVMSGRAASPLTDSLRRGTENLIIGGTGAAAAIGIDGTQTFREPFSKDNVSFMSPEAFGTDLAQLRMDVGAVINLAQNKAVEMGENVGEYVDRVKTAYDTKMNQDMENQRMQEIDAQQGMQPFSALLGPDMPLRRQRMEAGRGRTLSNVDRMIEAGRGSTTSDIDDLLSSMEKKN